jgi:5-methylthioadenosine/S-adenosylhomocysteine deaminase
LLRGVCDDKTLKEWLWDYVWMIEPKMTPDDAFVGALLGCAEMIGNGVTAFFDQYFFADKIAEAVCQSGMKAILCPSIFEGNPESGTIEASFKQALAVHKRWNGYGKRILVGLGPHAPYTIDPDSVFVDIVAKANELGTYIHTHLSETAQEVEDAKKKWGKSPIAKMDENGLLSERTLAAHCIHVNDSDIDCLTNAGVHVLHCPQSNMKIGAGIAPIPRFLERGASVCLGTDGQASNNNLSVLEEVTLTALVHKGLHCDPMMVSAAAALRMATVNPARVFPPGFFGGMQEKEKADFVVWNFDRLNTTPLLNPLSNLVYSSSDSNVALAICNGEILYEEGRFPTIGIRELLEKAEKASRGMIERSEVIL